MGTLILYGIGSFVLAIGIMIVRADKAREKEKHHQNRG